MRTWGVRSVVRRIAQRQLAASFCRYRCTALTVGLREARGGSVAVLWVSRHWDVNCRRLATTERSPPSCSNRTDAGIYSRSCFACCRSAASVKHTSNGCRTSDRKIASLTPGRCIAGLPRSTQPVIPPGNVNRVPAYWLWLRRRAFTCVGWQVTLCDSIWQVMSRSCEMGVPINSYTLFYLFK